MESPLVKTEYVLLLVDSVGPPRLPFTVTAAWRHTPVSRSLSLSQPGQHREFQVSQGYMYGPCVLYFFFFLNQWGLKQLQRRKELCGSMKLSEWLIREGPQPATFSYVIRFTRKYKAWKERWPGLGLVVLTEGTSHIRLTCVLNTINSSLSQTQDTIKKIELMLCEGKQRIAILHNPGILKWLYHLFYLLCLQRIKQCAVHFS